MPDNYTTVCPSDDREAWLAARLTGVGASESPVLLGLSTFASVMSLWGVKAGRIAQDDEPSDRMRWGVILEPHVAEEYERKTGRSLRRWASLLRSVAEPYMLATPDYAWTDEQGAVIPVEIKTTDFSRRADWADGPPLRVNVQCQHQMIVTGAQRASVGLLVGGNTFMWADVPRDEAVIASIRDACARFWRLVASETLPPVDASEQTAAALKLIFPLAAAGETLTLPPEAIEWSRSMEAGKAAEKVAQGVIQEAQNNLVAAIGSAEVGILPDGSGAWTYKNLRRKEYVVKAAEYRQLRRTGGKE
jgi:putative phage-type endonuclease